MERITQHDIVADLRELSVRPEDAARLPKGKRPSDAVLDRWARTAALDEPNAREAAVWAIREAAHAAGVIPASIQGLYAARGQGAWDNRTVPALNLRGWTYPTCRAAFRAARKLRAALVIFEQAVGEQIYAKQSPAEYAAAVLAAAVRGRHTGPGFPQADPDHINAQSHTQ